MRTRIVLACCLALACASAPQAKPPDASPAPKVAAAPPSAPRAPVPLDEYFKIRRVGSREGILLSFSFDEKLVAYLSDQGGRTDVWVQPVEGGPATQLTHVTGFIQSLAFSPTEDRLIYGSDTGGDELPHLYLTDSKGTAPRDLNASSPPGRRHQFVDWAGDGRSFLYLSSDRDEKALDLVEYELGSGRSRIVWESSGKLGFAAVSRDHSRVVVDETLSDANNDLYLVELGPRGRKEATPRLLTRHQGDVLHGSPVFSRDGKTLFFTSDQGREFAALHSLDLKTLTAKVVAQPDWDVEAGEFSQASRYFFVTTNVDGRMSLQVQETATGKAVQLPPPPPGGAWVPLTSSVSDRYLGVRLQGDGAPAAPYVVDLAKGVAHQVIEPLPASLAGRAMVVGESVRIPTHDGKQVPAFLYRPEGAGPFPAVIDVHGGPTAQSRREFSGVRQYLLSKGYAVLVPNVRGSTGYGKTWTQLDNLDLGGGPLQDVLACKEWLTRNAQVDPARVVILGGSYGGYMVLSAVTSAPEAFVAGVDYFGVSDLKTLVESFPPYWASAASSIYKKFGDPKNPAHAQYQHDRSPVHFIDRIVRPLLVVQGERDPRVRKDQSDRIVAALESRKVPVHYLVIPNEGHGFSQVANNLLAASTMDRFLDRYVFGDTSAEVIAAPK